VVLEEGLEHIEIPPSLNRFAKLRLATPISDSFGKCPKLCHGGSVLPGRRIYVLLDRSYPHPTAGVLVSKMSPLHRAERWNGGVRVASLWRLQTA